MKATKKQVGWSIKPTDPAILTTQEWVITGALGVLLVIAAVLQLVSFADFRDSLKALGIKNGTTTWGIIIIIAELWGAANLFKLRLSYGFRVVSAGFALMAAMFWFVFNLQAISGGVEVTSSGFFGRFLEMEPGWWTAIGVTVLLGWTLYAVALTRYTLHQSNGGGLILKRK